MAKNKKRNKKGAASMDISTGNASNQPEAMDISEEKPTNSSLSSNRKIKKGVLMKRSKNMRKCKAIEKAISKSEKDEVKVVKHVHKKLRIQSAKSLYE